MAPDLLTAPPPEADTAPPPPASRLRATVQSAGSGPTIAFRLTALALAGVLCTLVIVPLLAVAIEELWGAEVSPFVQIWRGGRLLDVLGATFIAVVGATVISTIVGAAFAWINERTDASLGPVGDVVPIVPLLVPPLAGAIGWVLLASPGPGFLNVILRGTAGQVGWEIDSGPLNIFSWYGLIFVYVLYLVPHVYLTVAAALRNLDPSLEEASRMSGAGSLRTLWRVTLPSVAPAIAGGALLALIFGLALFSIPILIATPSDIDILAVTIVQLMTFGFPPETGQAIAFGALMVAFISLTLLAQARLVKRGRQATIGGRAARPSLVTLGPWRLPARALMLTYLLTTSLLPLVALIIVSLQPFWTGTFNPSTFDLETYRDALSANTGRAFRNSVLLGVVGATVAMLIAAIITFACRRLPRRLARAIEGITKLPGAFSHVVLAVAFVAVFVGAPFHLQGTLLLLLIGYLVVYLPQATVSAEAAMGQIGGELIEASATCGGSDVRTFRSVVLPLMRPGLTAGWVFVFVLMAGDVTMSVLLASTRTPVVGFVMLDLFGNGTYPLLAAMGVIISIVSSAVVISVLALSRARTARATS